MLLDEGGFSATLSEITKRLKENKLEYGLASSAARAYGSSADELKAKAEYLSANIAEQKRKVDTLREAFEKAKQEKGEDSAVTQKLAEDVKKAETVLNDMTAELRHTNEALDDNARKAKESGDAAEKSREGWDKFASGLQTAAKAAGAALAAVGAAAGAAATGMFKIISGAAEAADGLLTMSQQTHISVQQLQKLKYAEELVDVPLETMTASMAKLVRSMSSAEQGNKQTASAFKQLGVSVEDANGNLRDNEEVFYDLIDALGKVQNETERDALSMAIFGKSAQDLNPLIEQGSAKLRELGDEAVRTGYVMGDDAVEKLGQFDDTMQRIKNQLTGVKQALGVAFLPFAQSIADKVLPYIKQFADVIASSNGDIAKFADGVSGMLVQGLNDLVKALPGVIKGVTSVFSSLLQDINKIMPQILPVIIQAVMDIAKCIIDNMPMLADAGIKIILALIQGVAAAYPELIPAAVNAVLQIVQALLANLPLLIDAGLKAILAYIQGLMAAIPQIVAALPNIIQALIGGLMAAIPLVLQSAAQIIQALINGLMACIPVLIDSIPVIITAIIQGLISGLPNIIASALSIIDALITGIIQALPVLIQAIPDIILAIIQGLIDNLPTLIAAAPKIIIALINGIGQNLWRLIENAPKIILAIIEGIGTALWKLVKKGEELIGSIWSGIKGAWEDVRKWFADTIDGLGKWFSGLWSGFVKWGKNIIDGILSGLKDAWNAVKKWFEDAWKWISDGWNKFWGIHSPSRRMMNVGRNIALGLGEGFGEAMKSVRGLMGREMDRVGSLLDIGGGALAADAAAPAARAGMAYNQTLNITINGQASPIEIARQIELQSRLLALQF